LFAERGIDGVTITDITVSAGQSNRSAVNYHFGGKDGLIKALLDTFQVRIESRRRELVAGVQGKTRATLRDWVWTLITPLGELLDDPGGVAYLRVVAQLISHPRLLVLDQHRAAVEQGGDQLLAALGHVREWNRNLWLSRWIVITGAIFHGLADYARMRKNEPDSVPPAEEFLDELVDAVTALMGRPPLSISDKTAHIGSGRRSKRRKLEGDVRRH
jgi:AcrR family transcriptional regulator